MVLSSDFVPGEPLSVVRLKGESEPLETCAVITTPANELVGPINDRMPVIIAHDDYEAWLDPAFDDAEELERMMQPFPADMIEVVPV